MPYSYDRRTAGSINDSAWNRTVDSILDTAQSMKSQVQRFGGIEQALQQGHGSTLNQQLSELASVLRTVQRRLG